MPPENTAIRHSTPDMDSRLSWRAWWGIELSEVSTTEKLVSILGGFFSIWLLLTLAGGFREQASAVIASMGASAVLLFAVPHGQLSQPWPVLAGHGLCALIGVCCARWIPSPELAGATAVALSIGAMHQFKCIHPPGGATALTAVLGGHAVHALGYKFIALPVLANAGLMVASAAAFNAFFAWRRYPAALNRPPRSLTEPSAPTHEEVVSAVRSLDSFVDISEDDLIRLVQILGKR
ncbi:HPP family protein [Luteolibacter sp. Populi]|uniref:HPP family protein n=1 Tax=Luteolibacter sp. Populi TaxID=3230487 RepID=UPI0034655DD4